MGSSSKIVRQLVLSSELSSRLSDRNGSLFEPFIELVIIFVCISCQVFFFFLRLFHLFKEYLFTGWSQCKLKILLDHILELMKGQNIVEERTHNEVIKYLELLTVIFDGVCIISPTPSSSESIKDLSFEIGSYIYPSLIDILSYGHCSPVIIDKVCKLMGKLSARHDREFLSETLDVLCCNFSRYFMDTIKHPPSSFNFATTRKQYLLFLSHLGTGLMHLATTSFYLGGGLDCEPPRIETPSKLRHPILLGIHKALVRLFLSLANAALGKAIEESIQHVRPIEGFLKDDSAIGLLCLIPPIASTMQLLTPSKENISNSIVAQDDANMITDMGHLISYDIFSLQSFWVHIALFQFWNRNYWEKRISQVGLTHLANMNIFELSLDQIVAFTPPLVEFRGGSSILYFESEMTSNVVAKSIMKCTNTGQLYGKYDWVDACTGFSVVKEIYKTPECNHINQNVGMILTLTAVFCLEKLRIEKFGDIRMIFYYLCDEGITSSNSTIILLTSFAKEFYFTQWKSDLNRYAHLFLHKTVNRLHYIDSSTIIIFLLSRCIHSSRFVRDLAFYYIESIYQSNSELFWEYTSIFTYLRCVDILGLLVHSPALNISPPDYLSMEPWNHDIYLNILPTMEFLGSEDISETSSKLLHFGYTFLTKGALESSELLVPILQEYILHSNWTSLHKSTIDSRIGLAMAHEFCHAGRPTFHFNNNPRSALLSRERFDAALFVSQSFGISCRDSKCIPHFVPENDSLFLKSLYVGQATGLMGSPSDESKSFSHDSYVLAFQSIFRSLSDLFFREQEISVEKCEQLILRGAALLRSFALQWDSIGDIFQFASVYLNYFTLVVKKCYSHQVISTVIFVWKWLLGCSPRILGPLILSNMIATLQQQVCTLSIGLFHRHNFSCHLSLSSQYDYRPSNAKVFRAVDSPFLNSTVHSPIVPCAADCFPFELWIDFMMKIFDIHGTLHMASLFSMMEILLHDVSLFSRDSSSMIARFKLLIFAFRILKVSVVPAKTFNISVHRRRILRERVYEAIVDFFNNQNAFTATNHVIVDKEILVLHDLLTVCFEDYAIWSVDYADGISESVNIAKSQAEWFRGCGSAFAVKYLRTLMSTKHLTSSETTIGPSLRTFGIQISGALRSNVSPLDNSILWFVNAIILRHINYLVAWRTSHNFLDSLTNSQIMNLNKRFKCVLKSSDVLFSQGVQISWIFSPSLALSYCERFSFRILKSNSLSLSCLLSLITTNPESIRNDWRVLRFLSNMTGLLGCFI